MWAYVRAGQDKEFSKYGVVIRDQCVPIKSLHVAISQACGTSYFQSLLAAHGVPGAVHVVPE